MNTLFVVSGGDAPGINAVIGQYAMRVGGQIFGALGGFPGLLAGQIRPFAYSSIIPWMGHGGSLLPSSRDPVLSQTEAPERIRAVLREHQIDNLVVFGGNGTLRYIPPLLREWGIPHVGLPTTIDNDVPGTELSLGFDSACNYAYHLIDGVMATAHALSGRMFMVETLGANCGNLALAIAQGSGAHVVLLPEYAYEDEWLAERMKSRVEREGFALCIINEFTRGARTLADELPKLTGIRMRDVRLGHAQRGGVASHRDRVLAAQMAQTAFAALHEGVQSGIVVVRGGEPLLETEPLAGTAPAPSFAVYQAINGMVS